MSTFFHYAIAPIVVFLVGYVLFQAGLRKSKMTVNELLAELRTKGYTNPQDIAMAMLESVGKVSVIPKARSVDVEISKERKHDPMH